ncbi:hypothetical protein [Leptospira ilyithenensis]|uniref:Lipoprotein n=1 Tax=Leptospira ilyithenensis TaxID=2484901 RepID=A0A4R9LWA1_9LEPT|nr:hypothetical protein [Leptospira ilyithenensis]TGN13392.1 hypothetical protein EHS11_03945 [Leptospira ilyithenensis]
MKKKFMFFASALILALFVSTSCKKEDNDDSTDIAALLLAGTGSSSTSSNCVSLPSKWTGTGGTVPGVYNCTVSGKIYTCIPTTGSTVVVTYASGTAGALGPVDFPGLTNQYATRGITSKLIGTSNNTFMYNTSSQQTAHDVGSGTVTVSNYDSNGFPKSASNGFTITYTYASGGKIPIIVSFQGNEYTYDSKGWQSKYAFDPTIANVITNITTEGSLSICN